MATPGMLPPSAVPNHLRQQLEELDTLIQRMLGLPVHHIKEEDAPSAAGADRPLPVAGEGPAATSLANHDSCHRTNVEDLPRSFPGVPNGAPEALPAPVASASPLEGNRPVGVDLPSSPSEHHSEPEPVAGAKIPPGHDAVRESPPAPSNTGSDDSVPAQGPTAPVPRPYRRRLGPRFAPYHRPRVSRWLFPLVWANRLFDWGTVLLGPPGRWLRGPSGRSFLG